MGFSAKDGSLDRHSSGSYSNVRFYCVRSWKYNITKLRRIQRSACADIAVVLQSCLVDTFNVYLIRVGRSSVILRDL